MFFRSIYFFSLADNDNDISKTHLNKAEQIIKQDFHLRLHNTENFALVIANDLSKQIKLENPDLKQQVSFIVELEKNEVAIFFIIEKTEETTFHFSQNCVSII